MEADKTEADGANKTEANETSQAAAKIKNKVM